jgi:hypothetical protein
VSSGFVSTPPAPASPAASTVEAGTFWPAIDVNGLRSALPIGNGSIPHERLVPAIIGAIVSARRQLAAWVAIQDAAGHASAEDVPCETVDGDPATVALWRRAVHFLAAAELADAHADLTATDEAVTRAEEKRTTADHWRRMATTAINELLRLGDQTGAAVPLPTGSTFVDLV